MCASCIQHARAAPAGVSLVVKYTSIPHKVTCFNIIQLKTTQPQTTPSKMTTELKEHVSDTFPAKTEH